MEPLAGIPLCCPAAALWSSASPAWVGSLGEGVCCQGQQDSLLSCRAVLDNLDRFVLGTLGLGTVPLMFLPRAGVQGRWVGGFPWGANSGAPRLCGSVCATELVPGKLFPPHSALCSLATGKSQKRVTTS